MRFLIAEDDGVWQRLEQSWVEAAGFQHTVVETWPKVISLLRQSRSGRQAKFDRMIVDLSLVSNSESGIEALQFVGQELNPPDTLVISTHSSNKLLQDCYALPFIKDVIQKSRIADHFDEIVEFFDGRLTREKLRSLLQADWGGGIMLKHVDGPTGRSGRETVFVVHGRDVVARQEMFAFLRALGLGPLEWSTAVRTTGKGAPYIGEVLDTAFHRAAAVVVLLTGDDEARLLKRFAQASDPTYERKLTSQPRPNVLFEAGLAFGRNPDRTILVQLSDVRPFSDVAGRHVVHFRGSSSDRNELATRLETAGCAVRRDGRDWLSAGKFDDLGKAAKVVPRRRK